MSELYGLKPKTIQAVNSIFEKFPDIEAAVIYGSRAKGNYRNGSDIDLTIKGESLDLSLLFRIETELDDLLLPYNIDLSIFHKIDNQKLVEHIERIGLVFYKKMI
jgi:predicted nucleotidyltransferase